MADSGSTMNVSKIKDIGKVGTDSAQISDWDIAVYLYGKRPDQLTPEEKIDFEKNRAATAKKIADSGGDWRALADREREKYKARTFMDTDNRLMGIRGAMAAQMNLFSVLGG